MRWFVLLCVLCGCADNDKKPDQSKIVNPIHACTLGCDPAACSWKCKDRHGKEVCVCKSRVGCACSGELKECKPLLMDE